MRLLKEIIDACMKNVSNDFKVLKEAVNKNDAVPVERCAHTIKGGASNRERRDASSVNPIDKANSFEQLRQPGFMEKNVGFFRDITAHLTAEQAGKRAEDALRESEEKHRAIVERIGDGIVILLEGKVRFSNPGFAAMLGYDTGEVEGMEISRFVPQESLGFILERYRKRMAGEKISALFETVLLHKSGREIIVEVNGGLVNYEGKPADLVVMRDITEHRRADEALKKSEERYRVLFEKSRDAIMTLEPPSWKFTTGNPATIEMFKTENENAFVACEPWKLSPQLQPDGRDSAGKAKEMIEKAMREGSHFFEWTHKRINGEEFPVTVLLSRVEQNGKVFLQATVRDVTERKQAEEEKTLLEERLRQAEKLRAVGELAGGIAHDFNNLLGAIAGYADMIAEENLDENEREKDPVLGKCINTILKASNRAADIIKKLLAFSQRGKYRNAAFDVHEIINDVITLLEGGVNKKVTIKKELPAQSTVIQGDPSQIQNAILNLAINACDAMPGGGELLVSTRNEVLEKDRYCPEMEAGNYLVISVSDTGVGMDEQTKSRIFEPFFTTKGASGTGLGLPSVYGAMKSHKGGVTVESSLGAGACFRLYMPVVNTEDLPRKAKGEAALENGHGTILVTDDEEMVRDMVTDLLTKCGYTVYTCQNGSEAVAWYKERHANTDLVILDMIMPVMDGMECYKNLKEINPLVKVVLASGYSINENVQKLLDQGAVEFIAKPFSRAGLSRLVEKVVNGKENS